jgi:putative DNA primase/helicase
MAGIPPPFKRQPDKLALNVRNTYTRYIVFHSDYADAESGAMMLWTYHTYLVEIADHTPYVLVMAPTSQAGKSLLFDVATLLVHNPMPIVDPSPAALYSMIEEYRPTLMIDEADMLTENKALRVILNAGFQPGKPVARAAQTYNVYCAKMFSGIAGEKPPLTEATLSRCIQIPLRRKSPHEHVEKFSARLAVHETALIKAALGSWADMHKDELSHAEPALVEGLDDRQQDIWMPLLAIADAIGYGDEARVWARTLTNAIPRPPDPAVQILNDVKRVLDAFDGSKIPSAMLADLRNALDERDYEDDLTTMQLSKRLAGFGIHRDANVFRWGTGRAAPVVRGYTFRTGGRYAHQWQDAFIRYGLLESRNADSVRQSR